MERNGKKRGKGRTSYNNSSNLVSLAVFSWCEGHACPMFCTWSTLPIFHHLFGGFMGLCHYLGCASARFPYCSASVHGVVSVVGLKC